MAHFEAGFVWFRSNEKQKYCDCEHELIVSGIIKCTFFPFFQERIFVNFCLPWISLSLSQVKVNSTLHLFALVQYTTACDQGLSAEKCNAS